MQTSFSIWTKLNRYPPVVVRLLATDNRQLLSDAALAKQSGLSLADIRHFSSLTSWDEVSVGKWRAFTLACGVDFADSVVMRRLNRLLKRGFKFTAARASKKWPEYHETLRSLCNSPE